MIIRVEVIPETDREKASLGHYSEEISMPLSELALASEADKAISVTSSIGIALHFLQGRAVGFMSQMLKPYDPDGVKPGAHPYQEEVRP